jgi:hypothetical protein
VQAVLTATLAELVKLKPVGVVALILGACVVALLALSACQVDDDAVGFLCHFFSPEIRSRKSEVRIVSDF